MIAAGCSALHEVDPAEERVRCDRLALEATETESLDEARRLASNAAQCYEDLQAARR